jgi:hypothetical protein
MDNPLGDWLREQATRIVQQATIICIGILLATVFIGLLITWLEWKIKWRSI